MAIRDVDRPQKSGAVPAMRPTEVPGGYVWGALRILVGWTFLWAFLDKLFGLGFATCRASDSSAIDFGCDAAFVQGGSPTWGFLENATAASHTGFLFDWMAPAGPTSVNVTDFAFMLALLLIGISLVLGIAVRLGGIGGAALLVFMYLAGFVWPENNPFLDDHLIEALLLVGLVAIDAGRWLGLGRWWSGQEIVRRYPILR